MQLLTIIFNIIGTGNTAEEDDNEDLTQSELFEEKLRETIDLATQKSANGELSKIGQGYRMGVSSAILCSPFKIKFLTF